MKAGAFATTYFSILHGKDIAIKCHLIVAEDFSSKLQDIIKEYCLLAEASSLKAGPAMMNFLNWNLIIYRNCIEFAMEKCENDLSKSASVGQELRESLRALHQRRLIHFDIKPDNICFSPAFNRAVFIDFGLSEIVREAKGEKTETRFKGSMAYCSEAMKKCLTVGRAEVDLYENDEVCLENSLN